MIPFSLFVRGLHSCLMRFKQQLSFLKVNRLHFEILQRSHDPVGYCGGTRSRLLSRNCCRHCYGGGKKCGRNNILPYLSCHAEMEGKLWSLYEMPAAGHQWVIEDKHHKITDWHVWKRSSECHQAVVQPMTDLVCKPMMPLSSLTRPFGTMAHNNWIITTTLQPSFCGATPFTLSISQLVRWSFELSCNSSGGRAKTALTIHSNFAALLCLCSWCTWLQWKVLNAQHSAFHSAHDLHFHPLPPYWL